MTASKFENPEFNLNKSLRKKLYGMRRVAGKIVLRNGYNIFNQPQQGEITSRVSWCGFRSTYGKNNGAFLVRGQQTGKVFISGVMHCGSVWRCPVCAFKITRQRQLEVYDILQHYHKDNRRMSFVTLTVAHKKSHSLAMTLDLLLDEFRKMQRLKPYKHIRESYVGMIKSLEVTYGKNGWHPHLHILFIHNYDVGKSYRHAVAEDILDLWYNRKAIQERGTLRKHQKQYEVYTAKEIGEYITKWDASSELTKKLSKDARSYTTKDGKKKKIEKGTTPFGLLADVWSRERKLEDIYSLYEEYVRATKGRANVIVSNGILKEMNANYPYWKTKTDDEILKDEFIDKVLFSIGSSLWYKLFTQNKVIDLQVAYEKRGMEGVYHFLKKYDYVEREFSQVSDSGKLWECKQFVLKNNEVIDKEDVNHTSKLLKEWEKNNAILATDM